MEPDPQNASPTPSPLNLNPLLPTRKLLLRAAAYAAFLAVVVGGRGWLLARMIGGRLLLSEVLFDMAGLGLILLCLHLFDHLLRSALRRPLASPSLLKRSAAYAARCSILVLAASPLLLAVLQLHPQRVSCAGTPAVAGLSDFKDVSFSSDGLRLAAWFLPSKSPKAPVVIVAHGIGANKENFLYPAVMMHDLGYAVLIFDFRAHGGSAGRLTTLGLKEAHDVKAAYDWAVRERPGRPVYALGFSMGGAAVLNAAAQYGLFDKIVVDSTFALLENVARSTVLKKFGLFAGPAWQMGRFWGWVLAGVDLADDCPERSAAALGGRPLLIIHGLGDQLIPPSESQRLLAAAGGRAQLWLVPKAGHAQSMAQPGYRARVRDFFAASSSRPPQPRAKTPAKASGRRFSGGPSAQ